MTTNARPGRHTLPCRAVGDPDAHATDHWLPVLELDDGRLVESRVTPAQEEYDGAVVDAYRVRSSEGHVLEFPTLLSVVVFLRGIDDTGGRGTDRERAR